jgi:hypothetical protein
MSSPVARIRRRKSGPGRFLKKVITEIVVEKKSKQRRKAQTIDSSPKSGVVIDRTEVLLDAVDLSIDDETTSQNDAYSPRGNSKKNRQRKKSGADYFPAP